VSFHGEESSAGKERTSMYGTSGGMVLGGGVASVGALATTGFPSLMFAIVGVVLIVTGLLLVRAVVVKQERPTI
jgi:sulfite exporter TauE/SafE